MRKPPERRIYLTPLQARDLAQVLVESADEEERDGEPVGVTLQTPEGWKPGDEPLVKFVISRDCYSNTTE